MPVTCEIVASSHFVTIRYEDPYSFAEWAQAMTAVRDDPTFEPGFHFLIDRTTAGPPPAAFAHAVATYVREHPAMFRGARSAIVVGEGLAFGMARMQEGLNEGAGLRARVFSSVGEAMRWLAEPS